MLLPKMMSSGRYWSMTFLVSSTSILKMLSLQTGKFTTALRSVTGSMAM